MSSRKQWIWKIGFEPMIPHPEQRADVYSGFWVHTTKIRRSGCFFEFEANKCT